MQHEGQAGYKDVTDENNFFDSLKCQAVLQLGNSWVFCLWKFHSKEQTQEHIHVLIIVLLPGCSRINIASQEQT